MPELAPSSPRPSRLATNLLVVLLCLIWGSTWLVIKGGLRDLPPLTSAGVRFAVAATVFALLAPFLHRLEGGKRPPFGLVAVQATLTFAIPYGIVYWGETVIPSGLASVLWAVFPMLIAIGGQLFLPDERLGARQWLGFLAGFGGVVLLFLTDLRGIGPEAVSRGALFLLSPLAAAVSQTLIKRHGEHLSSVLLNRNSLAGGAVLLLAAAATLERGATARWTAAAVASVAYLAVVGTVVTFGLFFWLLRFAPAHRMSLISYVIPAVALTLGWAVGQERFGLHTFAGTGLILAGVGLVARGRAVNRSGAASAPDPRGSCSAAAGGR